MLGVTFFGIFLTPVFYYVLQGLSERFGGKHRQPSQPVPEAWMEHIAPCPSPAVGSPAGEASQDRGPSGIPSLGDLSPNADNLPQGPTAVP